MASSMATPGQENGMGHWADSFLLASGKLQALCYKADIEAALRTPAVCVPTSAHRVRSQKIRVVQNVERLGAEL